MDLQTAMQPHIATGNLLAAIGTPAEWAEWVLGILMIAIGVVSLNFWYMALVRFKRKQELIPYQRSECVLGFIDVAVIFAVWVASQIAVGVVLVAIVGTNALGDDLLAEHGVLLMYLSAVVGIGSLVVSAVFLVVRYRTTNSFGLRFNQLGKQVIYGVAVFTMLFPPMMLVQWLLSLWVKYDHPILSVLAEEPSFVSIFSCWAAAVLAAPFVEEFLFRGVFQHWLERLSISKLSDEPLLIGGSSFSKSADFETADHQLIPTAALAEGYDARFDAPATDHLNPYQSPYTKVQSRSSFNAISRQDLLTGQFLSAACALR